jgi:hypothetical protein
MNLVEIEQYYIEFKVKSDIINEKQLEEYKVDKCNLQTKLNELKFEHYRLLAESNQLRSQKLSLAREIKK